MSIAATGYNGGTQLISQPNFVRSLDVTLADFDGANTANISLTLKTSEQNNSHFNPWKKNGGFILKPSANGAVDVLTWEDYERNGKVVDDTLKQTINVIGGAWEETRVIKVYSTSTIATMNIGTVI